MINPVEKLLTNSLDLHKKGDFAQAMKGYHGLLNRNPYDYMLLYLMGNVFLQQNKNGLAITMLEASIRSNDKHAAAWNDLGCALKAEHYDEGASMA